MSAPAPATRQRALAGLSTLGRREFATIWHKLNLDKPGALASPLAEVLLEIADKYGAAAATLAADWYDEARDAAGMPGSFQVPVAAPPTQGRVNALARWGVGPLFGADPRGDVALTLLSGGLQRLILNQARDTTFDAVATDPVGARYARHASANACAFCALMATRGATYASESSALTTSGHGSRPLGEKYHDDCHCAVVEVFPGQDYREAPYVKAWRAAYADAPTTNGRIDLRDTLSSMRQTLGSN